MKEQQVTLYQSNVVQEDVEPRNRALKIKHDKILPPILLFPRYNIH